MKKSVILIIFAAFFIASNNLYAAGDEGTTEKEGNAERAAREEQKILIEHAEGRASGRDFYDAHEKATAAVEAAEKDRQERRAIAPDPSPPK